MVERLLCKQDVGSSILPGSTRISPWLPTPSSSQGLRSVPMRAAAPAARSSRAARSSCGSACLRRRAAPRWLGPPLAVGSASSRVVATCRVRFAEVAGTVVCASSGRQVVTSRWLPRGCCVSAWRTGGAGPGRRGPPGPWVGAFRAGGRPVHGSRARRTTKGPGSSRGPSYEPGGQAAGFSAVSASSATHRSSSARSVWYAA